MENYYYYYLTVPTPVNYDISYVVQQVCLYIHDPREPYMNVLKHNFWYMCDTLSHRLHVRSSFVDRLVSYTDADWDGCPQT